MRKRPPGASNLGANFDNVYACGPQPGSSFPSYGDSFQPQGGFQCTELANRFLFDLFGQGPVFDDSFNGENLDGDTFAATVNNAYPSDPLIANGTANQPYLAGDIVSFADKPGHDEGGHVAVVMGSTYTAGDSGNYTITILEENSPTGPNGSESLNVSNWSLSTPSTSWVTPLNFLALVSGVTPPPPARHAPDDVNGDGNSDLAILSGVNGGTTGSGNMEVHVALGPNFATRGDFVTPFAYGNTDTTMPFLADINGDGAADLCLLTGVNGGTTGSGDMEVHCALGPNFATRGDFVTPFTYGNTDTTMPFFADINGDGAADLCLLTGVNGGTTGSGDMEVHCALGPNFATRGDFVTPFTYGNTDTTMPFFADINGDGAADLCLLDGIDGGMTGSGDMEVHCALGPNFADPRRLCHSVHIREHRHHDALLRRHQR